ncbi:hypothetical protein ACHWQZ_G004066 [Mnemiopsis leidyi]
MAEFVYFRYVLAVIAFYCVLVVQLTGSSFNVTILKMISNNCSENNATFCWNKEQEELLLASYYVGYIFQLPGGLLANQYGAYYVCGLGVSLSVVLTLVTPVVALHCDWRVLLAVRLVQGLAAAPTIPALSAMWTRWAPKHELSSLFAFTAAGNFIGAALADVLSGLLSDQQNILGGSWPSVFRIFGIIGILWAILWMTFASSDPDKSIWTSLDEKDYITVNRVPLRRNRSIPWLWILTSTKCWAIYFCHVCSYFGYLTMLVGYPQYFHDVHNMKIADLGAWSALPILSMFLTSLIAGKMTDIILRRNVTSVTAIRKINTAIGMFIPAILNFVLASFPSLSVEVVTALMSLQNAAHGFVLSGFQVNYIDINPDHAGVTRGVGNSLASSAGVIIPILLYRYNMQPKNLTTIESGEIQSQWKHMFASVGVVMTIGGLIYCLVGTGRRQMEGMEGYVEIAGTDSAAERTTYQTTSQNNSSTAQLDQPEVYGEGHTEVKMRPPSRGSIAWSSPGIPNEGTVSESIHGAGTSGIGQENKCLEVDDLIKLEPALLDTSQTGHENDFATGSCNLVRLDPGNIETPDPDNIGTTEPGNIEIPDPDNIGTTEPGNIEIPDPDNIGTTEPGNIEIPDSDNIGTTEPGNIEIPDSVNIGTTEPGNIETLDPDNIGTTDPGNIETLDPDNIGTTDPGNIETLDPDNIGTTDPGNIETLDSDNIGTTEPGNIKTLDPDNIGTTDPGNIETLDSDNIGTTDPGNLVKPDPDNIETLDPDNLGTTDPGNIEIPDSDNIGTTDPDNIETPDPNDLGSTDPGNIETTNPYDLGTTDPGNIETPDPDNLATLDPGNIVTAKTPLTHEIRPANEVEEIKWPSVKKMVSAMSEAASPVLVHRSINQQTATPRRHGLPARRYSLHSNRQNTAENSATCSKRRFSSDAAGFTSEHKRNIRTSHAVVESEDGGETVSGGLVTEDLDKSEDDTVAEYKIADNLNSEISETVYKLGEAEMSGCSADNDEVQAEDKDSNQVADDEPMDGKTRKFSMNSMLADMM